MRVIIETAEERVKNQRKIGPHSMQVWHRVSRIARCGLAVAVAVALRAGCGAVSAPVRSIIFIQSIIFVDVLACLEKGREMTRGRSWKN